jgi:hypothetical protein
VVLNELAQELRPAAEGVEWFEGLPEDEQRKVLHALVLFCGQARALQDDVPEGIRAFRRSPDSHARSDACQMAFRDEAASGL